MAENYNAELINSAASGESVQCPQCGTVNIGDSVFCSTCGTRLIHAAKASPADVSNVNPTGFFGAESAPERKIVFASSDEPTIEVKSPAPADTVVLSEPDSGLAFAPVEESTSQSGFSAPAPADTVVLNEHDSGLAFAPVEEPPAQSELSAPAPADTVVLSEPDSGLAFAPVEESSAQNTASVAANSNTAFAPVDDGETVEVKKSGKPENTAPAEEKFKYVEPNTVFAEGLPEWTVVPPETPVRRR